MVIGSLVGLAQLVPGQSPSHLLALEGGGRAVQREFRGLLGGDPGQWRQAWSRARQIGPPVASLLWERSTRESHPQRRLLWLATYATAAGGGAAARLLDSGWRRGAKTREQLLGLMSLAMGPGSLPATALGDLARDADSDALRLAACVALASRAAEVDLPRTWLAGRRSSDPGLCAAALLCGAEVPSSLIDRWVGGGEVPSAEAQLVWRADLLSRRETPYSAERRTDLAQRALRWSAESVWSLRRASILQIAEAGSEGPFPERGPAAELLVLLGSAPNGRRLAYRSGWLTSSASPRLEDALRAKLAVLFVQVASPDEIAAAAQAWRGDEKLLAAMCLAVAWRRFAGDAGLVGGPWLASLDSVDESVWARLALQDRGDPDVLADRVERSKNPALSLAADGRLPGVALAREAELELWKRDYHPRREAYRCWAELVRDLLLSGSDYARAFDARAQGYPYLPSDLQPGDRGFFEVATVFFDWLTTDGDAVPEGFALR